MPRARLIKYEFFRHDVLGHMPPIARLLFAGLWTLADREGRLKDNPGRILVDLFPYDTAKLTEAEVDDYLEALHEHDLVTRYEVAGVHLIQIVSWFKHQKPHPREIQSTLAGPPANARQQREPRLRQTQGEPRLAQGGQLQPGSSGSSGSSGSYVPPPSLRSGDPPANGGEKSQAVAPAKKKSRASEMARRGTRLPEGWVLPRAWGEWAMSDCGFTEGQVREIAANFADYWHGVAGAKGLKLDWLGTWRNRCRDIRNRGTLRNGNGNGNGHRETLTEARKRTAEAFGVAPRDRSQGEVFDLPPEDCRVVTKH